MTQSPKSKLVFKPLSDGTWAALESLFGPGGASGGCWCMWWKLRRSKYEKQKGPGNKRAFRKLVTNGMPTGVLAYSAGKPVGWCAVAPREAYPVLARSRVLKPVDDEPVWSVTCFYILRGWRRTGLTAELLQAAAKYAAKRGARIVEGYPLDPKSSKTPDAFAWTGFASAFRKAGFEEVARRSAGRPIMRRVVG